MVHLIVESASHQNPLRYRLRIEHPPPLSSSYFNSDIRTYSSWLSFLPVRSLAFPSRKESNLFRTGEVSPITSLIRILSSCYLKCFETVSSLTNLFQIPTDIIPYSNMNHLTVQGSLNNLRHVLKPPWSLLIFLRIQQCDW